MTEPEVEVIKFAEDIIASSIPCDVCSPDCIPVQTECTPICALNDPNVCDCDVDEP